MKKFIITSLVILICVCGSAQPKVEVRAVWLTTLYGLDWPHNLSPASQKAELCGILDTFKRLNINVVFFQTRLRGDVIYPSAIEPFNSILTGREGGNPGYDPLAFVIDECHKRGMECHAWIVALKMGKHKSKLTAPWDGENYLNPALPATKKYLSEIVREIVSRYNVDGVQFDYLRYPEHVSKLFDAKLYARSGRNLPLADWRRSNITSIVDALYHEIKSIKSWIKVSTCPIGKYCNLDGHSSGYNARDVVFQDSQLWMSLGIQDMICPMMYFKGNDFYSYALNWQSHNSGRSVVPGLGIYFMDSKETHNGIAWNVNEFSNQIKYIRSNKLAGECFFRAAYLKQNIQHIATSLELNEYQYPALPSPISWQDSVKPAAPKYFAVRYLKAGTQLSWQALTNNVKYNIYGSNSWPVDVNNAANIIALKITDNNYLYNKYMTLPFLRFFAVTAIDIYGNESKPTQIKIE
jgi:uncharacterized lipoprotein YddW (UPF0748 family)